VSAYAQAIEETRATVLQRAVLFKRLVMAMSASGLIIVVSALAVDGTALWAAGFIPAGVLAYHAMDRSAVNAWRRHIVTAWASGGVRLDLMQRTLRQVPTLPEGTLNGMLETLPGWNELTPAVARPALCTLQTHIGHGIRRMLATRALAWAGVVLASWGTTATGPWVAAALAALLIGLAMATEWISQRRLEAMARAQLAQWSAAHLQEADGIQWLQQLNVDGMPQWRQRRWARSLERRAGESST
jgi:hypothetical protein